MNEYEDYRKEWNTRAKRRFAGKVPLHADICLTTRCNLKCNMCPYHGKDAIYRQGNQDMDFELYRKIIDECASKGVKAIKFGFSGEPLLYPYIIDAIKYAKDNGIIDVQMNTNGPLLNSIITKRIIEVGLDLLILSDYSLDVQVKHAVALQSLKQLMGLRKPVLHVKSNDLNKWKGIPDVISTPEYYDYNNLQEVFDKSEFECPYPWQRFIVLADGTVMNCSCGSLIVDKFIGNVRNFSLEELWCGKDMTFMRFCHANHSTELLRVCRICPIRNEWIERCNE